MTWSFPIGRVLGSELRIHATFFLLLAWIGGAAWLQGGPAAAAVNIAFILALFACVVLHELGHALMARRFGIATPDITLLPIGGVAQLERVPENPREEILVALAGPAVNIVIWLVLVFALGTAAGLTDLVRLEDATAGFFARLASVNLFLVVFNMIPAFPMDGGRVFRALLSIPLGRLRATRIAGRAGQVLAFGFGLLGLLWGNPLLLLIAIFVFVAARAETADVALRTVASQVPARAAMITRYESLAPGDSLQAAADSLLRTTQHEFPVLGEGGRLEGFLTRAALFQALAQGGRHTVAEVMARNVPHVRLNAPLTAALDALYAADIPAVAVTDPGGTMIGYITRENVGELLALEESRASQARA